MNRSWLINGVSDDGFTWHGSAKPSTRRAVIELDQKLKQIWYLERATKVSRSVARICFPDGTTYGTGFLVAPNLILTNHHVFGQPEDTQGVRIELNYRQLFGGRVTKPAVYECDPTVFITNKPLDYTLVGLSQPAKQPYLRLRHGEVAAQGGHVAIIQHPLGEPLQVAMRDNSLAYDDDTVVEYITNTDYGSSGAPVFNDNWNVIALHSQRVRDPRVNTATVWYRNRGTKIAAILSNPAVNKLIPT